jgi:formate dehydrogenase subunit delta
MPMSIEHLVAMANDIAAFFKSAADTGEPAEAVAAHLRRFWDPRMRRQIVDHVARGGEGLVPIARAAVEMLPESQTRVGGAS